MEYLWYIIAAIGAGIGTGLAGLSAASVSHILIHPAILLERFDVMLLCIVVATVSSLVSAQFANRVESRTVGRVTGVVLTVLGAVLIGLHDRGPISKLVSAQ